MAAKIGGANLKIWKFEDLKVVTHPLHLLPIFKFSNLQILKSAYSLNFTKCP